MTRLASTKTVLAILVFLFLLLAAFLAFGLQHDFMRSDVLSYWNESTNWQMPFNEHPPFYALIIAIVRGLTFNLIPPIVLMMSINLVFFGVCIVFLMQFLQDSGVAHPLPALSALLFGLWPFVGLNYTVVPIADIPSIALTILGMTLMQRSKYPLAGLMFGLAIITHKGVWPIIGLLILVELYVQFKHWSVKTFAFLASTLLPLLVLWVAGAFYHNSINWLMERSIEVNTTAGGGYLILDGLIGTFQKGEAKDIVKGLIVLFFFLLSVTTLGISLTLKYPHYEIGIAIALAVLIMFLFSSAGTIWGPVRFSRFLVIPLCLAINFRYKERFLARITTLSTVIGSTVLFLSQLAYAWYIAKVYWG